MPTRKQRRKRVCTIKNLITTPPTEGCYSSFNTSASRNLSPAHIGQGLKFLLGGTRKQRGGRRLPLHTATRAGTLHPFLFMGCWNKIYEDERSSTRRDAVLDAVAKDTTSNIFVVAGDNAYPDKRKVKLPNGTKRSDPIFRSKNIHEGFMKMLGIGKQIWFGIGNHDIDIYIPFNNNKPDRVYTRERKMFKTRLPHDYYCVTYDDAALVFVDTNMIGEPAFNSEYPIVPWFKEILKWLGNTPYYIVQHEPLVALKVKDGTLRPFALKNGHLLLDLVAETDRYPIAVLSADIHNYQELDLTYKGHVYRQIVVGTGGASPNVVPRAALETFEKDEDNNYKVEAADLEALGFESIRYINNNYLDSPDYGYLRLTSSEEHEFVGIGQSEQFLEDGT